MFYTHALHEKREKREIPVMLAHTTLTIFTRYAQNSTVGCMLVLCVPTVQMKNLIFRPDKAMNLALLYEDIWTVVL